MWLEQNSTGEMTAFVAWLQTQNAGDPGAVKTWVNAQAYQGNADRYQNIEHLKTVARFHGPAVTSAQIDAAMATFRAS